MQHEKYETTEQKSKIRTRPLFTEFLIINRLRVLTCGLSTFYYVKNQFFLFWNLTYVVANFIEKNIIFFLVNTQVFFLISFAVYFAAGGSGAGPKWAGRSGVHVHMTNTRLTDPEILERRYPVRYLVFYLFVIYINIRNFLKGLWSFI